MRRRHMKCRVDHAERRQDVPLEVHAQRQARQYLDEPADHIGGAAVFPLSSRLMQQRQFAQGRDLVGAALRAAVHLRAHVHFLHRAGAAEFVGEPGRMAQQVLDGDGSRRRHPLDLSIPLHRDLKIRELGKVLADRIAQQEPSFFPQHHRGDRGDGFGHGINPENGVLRHRLGGGRIAPAEALEIADPPATRDERHRAGQSSAFNFAAHHRTQARESGGGEPDLLGRRKCQRGRCHGVPAADCSSSKPVAWLR